MRIVSGQYGGRVLSRPKTGEVRPMSEKVRGALFDSLGDVAGLSVADVYAGSGAAGLEALSRGARSVVLVEKDKRVAEVIRGNIRVLQAMGARVINQNVSTWVGSPEATTYDLVIADPPYDQLDVTVLGAVAGLVRAHGRFALSHSGRIEPPVLESMELIRTKRYGDSALSYYQRSKSE